MRNFRTLGLSIAATLILGLVGCSDTAGVTEKKEITTPTGTTTITKDTKVESSGSNPPIPVDGSGKKTTTTTTTNP